jgi:hypothetical protein
MRHFSCYGDARNKGFCVHCGGSGETDDHVPSKVFLDEPLPANVMVSPACFPCNNGLSLDEEYLACLIECAAIGEIDPNRMERQKIANILRKNLRLSEMLRKAKSWTDDGSIQWRADPERVRNVVLKLARGHVAYDLNEPQLGDPIAVSFRPLCTMTVQERQAFEAEPDVELGDFALWPEVGSRAMSALLIVGKSAFEEGWLVVQPDRYRYRTVQEAGIGVRFVIREYLACEVIWQ